MMQFCIGTDWELWDSTKPFRSLIDGTPFAWGNWEYINTIDSNAFISYKVASLLEDWYITPTYSLNFPDDRWILFVNGDDQGFYQSSALRPLNGKFSGASDLPMIIRIGKWREDI